MKLRNKKTGEILAVQHKVALLHFSNGTTSSYRSLAELNEEWEDYKPKEPLIKDPKVRKAVRAWAEVNKIERLGIQKIVKEARGLEDSWFAITGQDSNNCLWTTEIRASYSGTVRKDYKGEAVYIEELCGEEEE